MAALPKQMRNVLKWMPGLGQNGGLGIGAKLSRSS